MDASSPLQAEIRRLISLTGPMPVSQYMSLCLTHPLHGYYIRRDPFGPDGDFTTAPEISQMFGELIGLWATVVWRLMGSPENFRFIELGPGRGTMVRDALRAMQVVPAFYRAIEIHLVEISPVLEEVQRQTLLNSDVVVHWHRTLGDVPDGPTILVANEFLDTLPVHQAVKQPDGWHERVIGFDPLGNFVLGVARRTIPKFERLLPVMLRDAPVGSIFEWRADNIAMDIGRRVRAKGAALFIDYGHTESAFGDTLQSVSKHAFTDPLANAGMVDMTAHVDFQYFAQAAESMGASVYGPIDQGEFLIRLGIEARADALRANAVGQQADDIDSALLRLTQGGPDDMGRLFKAMAVADPNLGIPPGFET
jgi:NADH dehydrogenase [ubiquinone] 1 alpha subcomplex assembly factor 7